MVGAWEKAKAAALARDLRCQRCGHHDNLDVHHRKARGMGGTTAKDRLSNLLTLCRTCHGWAEHWPDLARELGLRLDEGQDPELTPVLARTVNGYGWWLLHDDGTATWADDAP